MPLVGSPDLAQPDRGLLHDPALAERPRRQPTPRCSRATVQQVGVIGAGIMGAGIAGAHVRRGVPALMLDNRAGGAGKGRRQHHQGDAEPRRDRPHDAGRGGRGAGAGSAPTHDLRRHGRPRRGHRGDRRERGGQGRSSISELQNDPAGPTRSWRRTRRPSRSRAWPRRSQQPENFAGMHFFNPVDRMQLVEVIRGEKTSDADGGHAGRPGQEASARRRSSSAIAPASSSTASCSRT